MGSLVYPKSLPTYQGVPVVTPPIDKTFFGDYDANSPGSDYRSQAIAGTGAHRFPFTVPDDFNTLVKLELVCSPLASIVNQQIDLDSEYGAEGQAVNNHSTSVIGGLYTLTGGIWTKIDITALFPLLAAGDRCGIFVDHKGIGTTIYYLGVRLVYIP